MPYPPVLSKVKSDGKILVNKQKAINKIINNF